MNAATPLEFRQHPILWLFRGWRFDPFPMSTQWHGHHLRVWNDPRTGELLYSVDGHSQGPLYSVVRNASADE